MGQGGVGGVLVPFHPTTHPRHVVQAVCCSTASVWELEAPIEEATRRFCTHRQARAIGRERGTPEAGNSRRRRR
eukprot:scaffold6_cov330-Pavlova_lutheri.AAC.26